MIHVRRDPGPCIVCDAPHTSCTAPVVIAIVQLPQRDSYTEPPLVGEVPLASPPIGAEAPLLPALEPGQVTTASYRKKQPR